MQSKKVWNENTYVSRNINVERINIKATNHQEYSTVVNQAQCLNGA